MYPPGAVTPWQSNKDGPFMTLDPWQSRGRAWQAVANNKVAGCRLEGEKARTAICGKKVQVGARNCKTQAADSWHFGLIWLDLL